MIKLNEVFETIQGEGSRTGIASVFIRLQGCDVGCGWCDTKNTWAFQEKKLTDFTKISNKQQSDDAYCIVAEEDLVDYIIATFKAKHIVITGGEPLLQDIKLLTTILLTHGYNIQIETSGTQPIDLDDRIWVTLSPKLNVPLDKNLLQVAYNTMKINRSLTNKILADGTIERANEIKMPIGKLADIKLLQDLISQYNIAPNKILLQPISQSVSATKLCMQQAIINNWRVSLQIHKYINIR
jgi:7-carboxy-7-deazaguanine synthase